MLTKPVSRGSIVCRSLGDDISKLSKQSWTRRLLSSLFFAGCEDLYATLQMLNLQFASDILLQGLSIVKAFSPDRALRSSYSSYLCRSISIHRSNLELAHTIYVDSLFR